MRKSGILLHISSLPGPGGIGSMGKEAYAFADFLKASGMTVWQVLPMGPTGYGESPYQSTSVFAGNPMLISIEKLAEDGLVTLDASEVFVPSQEEKVEFDQMRQYKEKMLRRAFEQSEGKLQAEIAAFAKENAWAEDFALFTAVKRHNNLAMWTQWADKDIILRKPEAVAKYRELLDVEVRYHLFCQYVFFQQWFQLKQYCNDNGIELFGDMPIYCAEDSADTWTRPEVFQLDENRISTNVAGVPPDCFSEDGQLWGNPLYDWNRLYFHQYDWWVDRMRAMSQMYDLVRVDHFIGFANYYSIPYGAPTAKTGEWIVGPGKKLFIQRKKEIPGLRVIAEDLGVQNQRVRDLLKFVGYPGMKVATFGFGGGGDDDENQHFPGTWTKNYVAYTGTHDNDTTIGWINAADKKTLAAAKAYLGDFETAEEGVELFMKCVLESPCETAMLPMQDILHLGGEARMNLPGSAGGNWAWRMKPGAASDAVAAHLKEMNTTARRG
ncbi:MAG: 4-alpha-glucanotransferase [Clostridia bacterium]|nr:4-alpha-glucanotransferase [Clostridia bacterium]